MRPLEFFAARSVVSESGCWNWTGYLAWHGYGSFHDPDRRTRRAHRGAWESVNGRIPAGMHVLHRCDNPSCVNPDHLWLGTHTYNMRDRARKGRANTPKGERSGMSRLTAANVAIIKLLLSLGVQPVRLGRLFGVWRHTIGDIKDGKTWRHVPPAPGFLSEGR